MTIPNDLAVRHVLEAAGVMFIDENGDGPGVRFASDKKRNREKEANRTRDWHNATRVGPEAWRLATTKHSMSAVKN